MKKLTTDSVIPKEQKEMSKFLQDEARKLATMVLGEGAENEVEFVVPLHNIAKNKKGDKTQDNTIPPFKIVFKQKETGVAFREAGIAKSKSGEKHFEKSYFTHMQNAGTRVRTMLMWGVVDGLKKKGKECWVNQNLNKPNIQIKEGGKIVKTITYIQAMQDHADLIDPILG